MNPRSSSAVINRWMPDFERKSSASFISSNDGGTPASFSRSWMKRRSSNCLRVSMSFLPPAAAGSLGASEGAADSFETNHEHTLSVRYVFRNHLISREQVERPLQREL